MPFPEAPQRADPSPFDLPGRGGAAVLCLHGLTGTPYELRPLGEALSRAGLRAFGPALPGHNERPEALARVRYSEWLEAAHGHLAALRSEHDRVHVVGLSMGGLLTLALCAQAPVTAAVVIGTPLRLPRVVSTLVPLLKHVMPFRRKPGGSDICDPAARARHPSYPVMPLASVHELIRLQRVVRAGLGRVQCPLLAAHGAHDSSADPADSLKILESVGSREREHLVLEDSAHIVPCDRDGPRLAEAVVAFLGRHGSESNSVRNEATPAAR